MKVNKSTQFSSKEDFNKYIKNLNDAKMKEHGIDWLLYNELTPEEIIESLLKDGYTDLDNLVADGHAYEIGGHTNNGWLWDDEVDMNYIAAKGKRIEIRKR